MKSLAPNFFVRDMDKTIDFYKSLGFEVTMSVPAPDNKEIQWAMMKAGEVIVMFQTFVNLADQLPEISREKGGSLLLYIQVDQIRKFFEKVKSKVTVLHGLEKAFYGATEFSILDNNGYVLTFAEDEK